MILKIDVGNSHHQKKVYFKTRDEEKYFCTSIPKTKKLKEILKFRIF